ALGRVLTLVPNRKFEATGRVAHDVGLVARNELGRRAFARDNAAFVWSYYLRFALLAFGGTRRRQLDHVRVLGESHLTAAHAHGRGLILLSVHLGDFDAAGAWLAERRGITPVVTARPIRPAWRETTFTRVRRRCGVVVRDARVTRLEDLETDLGQRRAVLVMLDRRPAGRTITSRILGRTAVVPRGIADLAVRTRAPLIPTATWRDRDGFTVAWFGAPAVMADESAAATQLVAVASQLSEVIRMHPVQWHIPTDLREMAWSSEPSGVGPVLGSRIAARQTTSVAQVASPPSASPATAPARRMSR
ncbi:MAG: phosphatidylinositol dimannoside acyltransferase, partial [Thermoleophilaceae bacterium]|nr:phosphatidylinositol dimannoside acyltransferase [Thermoleophilaceae bacterium]